MSPKRKVEADCRKSQKSQNAKNPHRTRNINSGGIEDLCLKADCIMKTKKQRRKKGENNGEKYVFSIVGASCLDGFGVLRCRFL